MPPSATEEDRDNVTGHALDDWFRRGWIRIIGALRQRIVLDLRSEADPGRLILWLPVFLGIGILLYFGAAHEPSLVATWLVAGSCMLAAYRGRGKPVVFALLLVCASLTAGFAMATSRTAWVAHEAVAHPSDYPIRLQGYVEQLEKRARSDRIVMRLSSNKVRGLSHVPERVRITLRKGTAPPVGTHIEQLARLMPPLQPAMPRAHDFGRRLWFEGIDAIGYGLGAPHILAASATEQPPLSVRLAAIVQSIRVSLAGRIGQSLSGTEAAIAVALVTGDRAAIPQHVEDSMRASGLTHILSISGLHMAMVAGTLFALVRGGLALFPGLALGWPIKSFAAITALAGSAFYLILSGNGVPAQRSFIMTALVLIGVMTGRQALTLRTVAVALLIVLALTPEALLEPGMQMSFAATLALVAGYQGLRPYLSYPRPEGWFGRILWIIIAFMGGIAVTSILAGFATAPYGAFHFYRASTYGLLSNLAAMPAVSLLVMPFGLIGVLFIPFGWDFLAWPVMGLGIEIMVAVSDWCAALPGASLPVTWVNTACLLLLTLVLLLAALLQGVLKFAALPVLLLALLVAGPSRAPDILIAPNARTVAVRGEDGRLSILEAPRARMLAEQWLRRESDMRTLDDPTLSATFTCDDQGCVTKLKGGETLAVSRHLDSLEADCLLSDFLVTQHMAPGDCPARVLTKERLFQSGTLALYWDEEAGWHQRISRSVTHIRPWIPQPAPQTQPDAASPEETSELSLSEIWAD